MASTIQAHLLYAGHAVQIGDITALTEMWISHNLRPDLSSSEYLPTLGDSPLSGNLISAQTTLSLASSALDYTLSFLRCKNIAEQEYIEGKERGTIYTVQYDDQPTEDEQKDPTNDDTKVILNISSGSEVVSYYPPREGEGNPANYVYDSNGDQIDGIPITKVIGVTNVSTTKRYRNKSANEIIGMGAETGKINNSSMWGLGQGCILFTGIQTVPIQEYERLTATRKINWNVTNNYQIKYIPSLSADVWQYVWYHGDWTRVYDTPGHTPENAIELYSYGTIPNDLT
jgi:hypothetical protein